MTGFVVQGHIWMPFNVYVKDKHEMAFTVHLTFEGFFI